MLVRKADLRRWLLCPAVVISGGVLAAQPVPHYGEPETASYTLSNGLQVMLETDRTIRVTTVAIRYWVGFRDERAGEEGFAHLFEHLLAPLDLMKPLRNAGYRTHGATSPDWTEFTSTGRSEWLPYALWLEAVRVRAVDWTDARLARAKATVKEEMRLNWSEMVPYRLARSRAQEVLPYNRKTCAYGGDLFADVDSATLDDAKRWFRRFYAPNNAALVITGDFDISLTRRLIEEYFGPMPRRAVAARAGCTTPFSHLPVRALEKEIKGTTPAVFMTYAGVSQGDDDLPALEVLSSVLRERLSSRLVTRDQLARSVEVGLDPRELAGTLRIAVIGRQPGPAEALEQIINDEIRRVKAEGPDPDELGEVVRRRQSPVFEEPNLWFRAKNLLTEVRLRSLQKRTLERDRSKRLSGLSPAALQRIAQRYLSDQKRVVLLAQPVPPAGM